jgi:hypothetical protein
MSMTGEPLMRSCCVQLFMKLSEATVPFTVPLYFSQTASSSGEEEATATATARERNRVLSMVLRFLWGFARLTLIEAPTR